MAFVAADPSLKMNRVIAIAQHIGTIIRLQKNSMTFPEIPDHLRAGNAYIRKNTHMNGAVRDHKAMRVAGIVRFFESRNRQAADIQRLICGKGSNEILIDPQITFP
jgi:hypothetical protein